MFITWIYCATWELQLLEVNEGLLVNLLPLTLIKFIVSFEKIKVDLLAIMSELLLELGEDVTSRSH